MNNQDQGNLFNFASSEAESLISLEKIQKVFVETGTRIELFNDLSFSISRGDFVAIKGSSGVGKSTLLHILGMLERPTEGRVLFKGKDTSGLGDKNLSRIRNQEIGFVFQFHHLLPDLSVLENVLMPSRILGIGKKEAEIRALELIEMVGMSHRLKHLPAELSGGERQRISLARALMNKPGILLCDEPSGNLDVKNSEQLHAQLLDLNQRLSVAILVVTHDLNLANLAQRTFMLENGVLKLETDTKGVTLVLPKMAG